MTDKEGKSKTTRPQDSEKNRFQRLIYYSVEENTILHFLLQHWVPGIVSFLIGGVLVSILMPYIQADFETERFNQQRRKELTEQVAEGFGPYLTNWRRLRQITAAQKTLESGSERWRKVEERRKRYIEDRDEAKDELYATLERSRVYFGTDVVSLIEDYQAWDDKEGSTPFLKLSPLEDWKKWRDGILEKMIKEVDGNE